MSYFNSETIVALGQNGIKLMENGIEGVRQLAEHSEKLFKTYEESNCFDDATKSSIEMLSQRLTRDDISEQERKDCMELLEKIVFAQKEKNDADREMVKKFHNDNKETWWITLRIAAGIFSLGASEAYFIPVSVKKKKAIEYDRKAS